MQINLAFFLFGVFHVYEVLYREKTGKGWWVILP